MSNYSQVTSFTPKDALASGNPAKVIKGSDFDAEFGAISTAIATKADSTALTTGLATKQDTLDSGVNIKTIQGQSIVGSGNLEISGTPDFVLISQGII